MRNLCVDVLGDTIFRCEVWLASGIFLGVVVRLEDVGATLYWCGSGCGVAVEVLKRQWWCMDGVESTRQRVAMYWCPWTVEWCYGATWRVLEWSVLDLCCRVCVGRDIVDGGFCRLWMLLRRFYDVRNA